MRFYGAEYNNIERGKSEFNIVVLCSIKPSLENKIILRASLTTLSDNWNHLMRLRDMKYIDFKHQRENKQNSDKTPYCYVP
jgi:hypothetical protein